MFVMSWSGSLFVEGFVFGDFSGADCMCVVWVRMLTRCLMFVGCCKMFDFACCLGGFLIVLVDYAQLLCFVKDFSLGDCVVIVLVAVGFVLLLEWDVYSGIRLW